MDKQLGKEYSDRIKREAFLRDNCDEVEEKGYMKPYSKEELQGHKENLANVSIQISEIEAQKRESDAYYKGELKPLREKRDQMVSNIKAKAEYVTEQCYKFVDQQARETGYYNSDGDLIETRPATADELQPNIFQNLRVVKTGTDDK